MPCIIFDLAVREQEAAIKKHSNKTMFRNIHKYRGKRVVMISARTGVLAVLLMPLSGCINQTTIKSY